MKILALLPILTAFCANLAAAEEPPSQMTKDEAVFIAAMVEWAYQKCPRGTLTAIHYMVADAVTKKAPPAELERGRAIFSEQYRPTFSTDFATCRDIAAMATN